MKKILSLSIAIFCYIFVYGQDIYNNNTLTDSSYINIDENKVFINFGGEDITCDIKKFKYLLDKDLFSYFDLNDKYSTQLQKNVYKKTADYAELSEELNSDYAYITHSYLYVLKNLRYNTNYDVDKKCFYFRLGACESGLTKVPGYIGLSGFLDNKADVCVTFPPSRVIIKKELTWDGTDYWVTQAIRTPIIPEDIALEIESGMESPDCSIALMFVVIPQRVSKEYKNWNGLILQENFILAKTVNLYVVDTRQEKVLYDLSKMLIAPVNAKKKR